MEGRKVLCAKFKQELPGLAKAPFAGDLGMEVFNHVSERAWRMWSEDLMIKVINEYRLNLADVGDYQKLMDQMKAFLGLDSSQQILEVNNPDRGK